MWNSSFDTESLAMGSTTPRNPKGLPARIDEQLHRRVVRVGAASAWLCAALYLTIGLATGDGGLVGESLGPTLAAALMTAQIVLQREHGGIALFGSAAVIVVTYAIVANPDTAVAAAVALVVVFSLAMLFVRRNREVVAGLVAIGLVVTPSFWGISGDKALQVGLIMSLSFLIVTVVLLTIAQAATAISVKYRGMFEDSPVALFDEDWAEAIDYLHDVHAGEADEISEFLSANPGIVREAVGRTSVTRVNRAGVDLFQAPSARTLLGKRDPYQVSDQMLRPYSEFLVNLYAGSPEFELTYRTDTFRGSELWVQVRCVNPASNGGLSSVLVAVADITLAHGREEELAQLVAAKDRFIASVSHELRTPLTAVVGLTASLSDPSLSDEETAELTDLVSDQAAEMSNIIEDLLVASRADLTDIQLSLRAVDLKSEVETTIASVDRAIVAIPANLPEATADAARVRQILRNLFTNAERYGGPDYRVVGGSAGGRVWVEVRDNGDGVAPPAANKIFEPYTTAHPGVSGSVGLGLSVSRQLAEMMDGSLEYRRESGETVFRLELPMALAKAEVAQTS